MRKLAFSFLCSMYFSCNAATVIWNETMAYRQKYEPDTFMLYAEYPGLYEGTLVISIPSEIFVSVENVDTAHFRLTFSHEMYGSYENWVIAHENSIVDATNTRYLRDDDYLLHYMLDDNRYLGSKELIVEANTALYLAFVCSDVNAYSDPKEASVVYGWVELAVDGNGNVVVSSSAADLDGGPMVVGGGAWEGGIPEPSGGMLFLLGAAALGLRRISRFSGDKGGKL